MPTGLWCRAKRCRWTPGVQPGSGEWLWLKHEDPWLLTRRQAAFCGLVLTTPQTQRLQADHAVRQQETANFHTGADDARHSLQKNGRPGGLVVHGRW